MENGEHDHPLETIEHIYAGQPAMSNHFLQCNSLTGCRAQVDIYIDLDLYGDHKKIGVCSLLIFQVLKFGVHDRPLSVWFLVLPSSWPV